MRDRKWYEVLILLVYVGMILVFLYLNLFAEGQAESVANIIVNVVMFAIVGVIFFSCEKGSFRPISKIIADLNRVTQKIETDAKHEHGFLWERYKDDKEELFTDARLKELYQDYQYELYRIVRLDKRQYKCDIENYFNYDLVDQVMHRDQMNQVAGVMTGLGILGTFIGLSLGLKSFNTGTTAEIANSIEPLMDGIKVAFHTSIYGMVFSLVFNYVYRRRMEEAEQAIRSFVGAYKKYVMPDPETEGINRLMELEQKQTEAIRDLSNTVAHQLSEGLTQMLMPQFDRFDRTIQDFANMATKNQMDALTVVVRAFLDEMDESMNGTFSKLSVTIDRTLDAQLENQKQIEAIYERNAGTAENIREVSRQTGAVSSALGAYAAQVQELHNQINETVVALRQQNDENRSMIVGAKQNLIEMAAYRESLDSTVGILNRQLKDQEILLTNLQKTIATVPKNVDDTFKIINENLQYVENHFKDTIVQIRNTTDQVRETIQHVPDAVDYSYRGIEVGLNRASQSVEQLADSLESLERYYRRK